MPPMTFIKPAGQAVFASYQLKLPSQFKPPSGNTAQDHYSKAFKDSERNCMPQLMPPWFTPAESGLKYYVDSCDKVGSDFKSIHDDMIDAVGFAHTKWKSMAKFKDLKITGPAAIGGPGCLDGEPLESDIKNAPMCASWSGNKAKYRDAIAAGVSKKFKEWQDKVTVPGLPMYPLFAMFPLATAPPTPSIPQPLALFVSAAMTSMIMPAGMRDAMVEALDGDLKSKDPDKQHKALFDAIATVVSAGFSTWLGSQQVMGILGKGPVPAYAPPYVPMGPVLGGDVIAAPGALAL